MRFLVLHLVNIVIHTPSRLRELCCIMEPAVHGDGRSPLKCRGLQEMKREVYVVNAGEMPHVKFFIDPKYPMSLFRNLLFDPRLDNIIILQFLDD